MLNSIFSLSTEHKNDIPFPKAEYCIGTFAAILKSALNTLEKEYKIRLEILHINSKDTLYMYYNRTVRVRVCIINGNSSVMDIEKKVLNKIRSHKKLGVIA